MALGLLIILTIALMIMTLRDRAEYARFKQLTTTEERQRTYLRWLLQSFALFVVGSLLALLLIGDLPAIGGVPAVFAPLVSQAQVIRGDISAGFLEGVGIALVFSMIAGAFLAVRRSSAKPVVIGDIEALMPRNGAEMRLTTLLSINAGLGEEIFFRLVYPLLLTIVIGNVLWAFLIAAAVFGLMHLYQGVIGVVATAVVGGVMTVLYLATGSLLWPILLHAAIDLRALVLQPALTLYFRDRAAKVD